MLVLKLKASVDNKNLSTLNSMEFTIKAGSKCPLNFEGESISFAIKNGDGLFYSDSNCTDLIGQKVTINGSTTGKLYIKCTLATVVEVYDMYNVSGIGKTNTGVAEDGGDMFSFNIDQLKNTSSLIRCCPTFSSEVFGNIESLKNNTSIEHVAFYRSKVRGNFCDGLLGSKDTLKTSSIRGTKISLNIDQLVSFNKLADFYGSTSMLGDLKNLPSSIQAIRFNDPQLSDSFGKLIYTGSTISYTPSVVDFTYKVMIDRYTKDYLRDLSKATWVADSLGWKKCTLVFENLNNAIIATDNSIADADIRGYVSELKSKGVVVVLNGISF